MPQTLDEFLNTSPNEVKIIEWMRTAADDELRECLVAFAQNRKLYVRAQGILDNRRHAELTKPHWTLTPTFWLGVAIFVVSILAFIISILAWMFPREPKKEPVPISQPSTASPATSPYTATLPTNAAQPQPALPPATQTSKPVSAP